MIDTIEQLETLYGHPHERAIRKEIAFLSDDYRAFVEASPFVVLSSVGPEGTDCSPRGEAPGFVHVLDDRTIAIPDRPGNNRLDTLRNLIADPRISVLFLVPGIGETLRINGRATLSTDPDLLSRFAVGEKRPRVVLIVSIAAVYFHCAKAIVRSKLWDPTRHVARTALPSPGTIHERLSGGAFDGAAYDRDTPNRVAASLY